MPPAIAIARHFSEAIAALRAVHDFDEWIGQYWSERCALPANTAAAGLPIGAEDAMIWHETEDTVFGYLPGYDGCFSIPRDAPLPHFAFVAGKPPLPFGQDIVISAAMREELQPPGT